MGEVRVSKNVDKKNNTNSNINEISMEAFKQVFKLGGLKAVAQLDFDLNYRYNKIHR